VKPNKVNYADIYLFSPEQFNRNCVYMQLKGLEKLQTTKHRRETAQYSGSKKNQRFHKLYDQNQSSSQHKILCSADLSANQPAVIFSHQISTSQQHQPTNNTSHNKSAPATSNSQLNRVRVTSPSIPIPSAHKSSKRHHYDSMI